MKLLSSNPLNLVRNSLSWRFSDTDDASTTSLQSTVTVDGPTKKHSPHITKVCIDESRNAYFTNKEWYKEDCVSRWFSKTELKRFKALTVSTARAIAKCPSEGNLYKTFSYKNVLLTAYDACCQTLTERSNSPLSKTEQAYLNSVAVLSIERIGLESLSVPEIRQDKQARRAYIVDTVMELYERCADDGSREEQVRALSQSISRAPRLYAQITAQAQATVAV